MQLNQSNTCEINTVDDSRFRRYHDICRL